METLPFPTLEIVEQYMLEKEILPAIDSQKEPLAVQHHFSMALVFSVTATHCTSVNYTTH